MINRKTEEASFSGGKEGMKVSNVQFDNAATYAATGEEGKQEHRFLTVHEVAALLQAPVSWVYAPLRSRCADRLSGFRLEKHCRFHEYEIIAWVECHQ